jgi:hypothetical protein
MTPSKRTVPRSTADFSSAAFFAAVGLGIASAIAPTSAHAETQVRGTPQAIVVEAQNATVEEVLAALTDTFKVRFRSAANLDKRLTGTYAGTLQQAVSRILKGYDFVVKSGPAGLEITLLGSGTPAAVVGARAATRPTEAAATQSATATADAGERPLPLPGSGAPTPPIRVAEGTGPVPTRPDNPPGPVRQLTPGPVLSPMPSLGAASSAPPLLTVAASAPPSPMPATPTSSVPAPSPSATMATAP